jgi:hypothetical protein
MKGVVSADQAERGPSSNRVQKPRPGGKKEERLGGARRDLPVSFVVQHGVENLKGHDLITSPAFILMKAADTFAQPTSAPNQLWQTDFTYLRVVGWGWF